MARSHFCRNGFVSRSSPIVVSGPCPGVTWVSSGRASTRVCSERMIFSNDPPGKSVRPILPAKSVSPAINFFLRGSRGRSCLPYGRVCGLRLREWRRF